MSTRDAQQTVQPIGPFDQLTLYDLVLITIPLAFLLGVVVAAIVGLPIRVGISSGGLVALAATAYGLFGVPPVEKPPQTPIR